MNCDEARMKLNAMLDNEIEEGDVAPMISHLESCYKCRRAYVELLDLQKKMKGVPIPQPRKEWYDQLPNRILRRATGLAGRLFFIGSYVLLLGYSLYSFFTSQDSDLFVKLVVGGIVLGFFVLLVVSISDRMRESRTDRYKGVMR